MTTPTTPAGMLAQLRKDRMRQALLNDLNQPGNLGYMNRWAQWFEQATRAVIPSQPLPDGAVEQVHKAMRKAQSREWLDAVSAVTR